MSYVQLNPATSGTIIACEPWDSIWPEVGRLAEEHFDEVDGGVEPRRKLKLDVPRLRAMSLMGCLLIVTARRDGRLVGYYTWQIMPDVESEGLLIAQQGAWFVTRAAGSVNLGYRMFERSIAELKLMNVKMIFPHHRLQGRGTRLGRFFEMFGAKPIQHTYSLWIGDI